VSQKFRRKIDENDLALKNGGGLPDFEFCGVANECHSKLKNDLHVE
jgi:hypothetical protein